MNLTKQNLITKEAFKKGYRVSECGCFVKGIQKKFLKLHIQIKRGKEYYTFNFRPKGEKPTRIYVHKLKAYQLFGDEVFQLGIVVRHLNDVSTDNSDENISLGTQLENVMDRIKNMNNDEDLPF